MFFIKSGEAVRQAMLKAISSDRVGQEMDKRD
jgi:hypothetical protein